MSDQKNSWLETLIKEISKNLSLVIDSIFKLGKAHPRLALSILAVPIFSVSVTLPMLGFWFIKPASPECFPQERPLSEQSLDKDMSDSLLDKQFGSSSSDTSEKPRNLGLETFPIMKLPLSNEFNSSNLFFAPNFRINAPPDRGSELGDNTNILPKSHLLIFLANDDKIKLNPLSDLVNGDILNIAQQDFETLIWLDDALLSDNLGEGLLLSLAQKGVKSVPDPASVIALLAIAGVGLKILKKRN